MRIITKPIYYCDYCKKKTLVKGVMIKHELSCSKNPNVVKEIPDGEYARCVDIWLKELHPEWVFTNVQAQALKSIMSKLRSRIKTEITETTVSENFRVLCKHLPIWYLNKELTKIDQSFNEIIEEIRENINGTKSIQQKPISKYF